MRGAWLLALALVGTALAGCIGGDDEGQPLGTYALTSGADAGGEHAGHGGPGALAGTIELFHFNGTRAEVFEFHESPIGVALDWSLSTGSAQVRLFDGNFEEVLNQTLEGEGSFAEAIEAGHGTYRLNITGTDATGTLAVATGKPAALGLSQSEPIEYSELLVLDTSSTDWTWDSSTGNVLVTVTAMAASGTATLKFLDGMANPLDPVVVSGPTNEAGTTYEVTGVMGTWQISLQTELFVGELDVTIAPADAAADEPEA